MDTYAVVRDVICTIQMKIQTSREIGVVLQTYIFFSSRDIFSQVTFIFIYKVGFLQHVNWCGEDITND